MAEDARDDWRIMIHYLLIFALVYIVALLLAPHQVITTTVVLGTAVWNLLNGFSISIFM
jgi:hypothetical protein